ncbi:NUDIX hydrolase [Cohnella fermenti]|uniref:NUDIX hydrolase n=1 Tax=Cohnella fermenti TaxID=2565925 RepID=A0A4V3WET0_9BACL|nr:NUDIX hydrolase [Cohnella fermenti]THF77064.1 NUDIX hydrolase [Cohnella fermenti]
MSKHPTLDLQQYPPTAGPSALDRLKLFLSFDIVGSTEHKQKNPESWQSDFNSFYVEIENRIRLLNSRINRHGREIYNIRPWKRLGDEVIFETDIISSKYLLKALDGAFEVLHTTAQFLENNERAKPYLSLKAAAWVCPVDHKSNISPEGTQDFIGKHIDEGFRVAGNFAKRRQLAVSCELAYLVASFNEHSPLEPFYFLGYRPLKGVWQGSYYPVIWFSNNLEQSLTHLPFDQQEKCELTKLLGEDRKMSCRVMKSTLERVIREKQLDSHAASMVDYLQAEPQIIYKREDFPVKVEVHNAIICYDEANQKFLLHKRPSHRGVGAHKWAAPGGQININESLEASCRRKAYEELNISDITPKMDVVVPYFIPSNEIGVGINGFRVLCLISPAECKRFVEKDDPDEKFKWFSLKDLSTVNKEETVPNLYEEILTLLQHFNVSSQ